MDRRKTKNEDLNRLSAEEFKKAPKNPLVVILDNVRSLNNVGSVFRTCDAFLAEKIFLTGITGTPPHRDINKTALGATESVDWEYRKEIVPLIRELKQAGYITAAIEQVDDSIRLDHYDRNPATKFALVFGNEVTGVDENVINEVDICLEIPQLGTKHSLNISVSAGLCIWEFVRHRLPLDR